MQTGSDSSQPALKKFNSDLPDDLRGPKNTNPEGNQLANIFGSIGKSLEEAKISDGGSMDTT